MKAEISTFHSPDVDDLAGFHPDNPDSMGFLLQVLAGPEGTGGAESFDVLVGTPDWFLARQGQAVAAPGLHTILITKYDWPAIETYIRELVDEVAGDDWAAIATELHQRLGSWELADYVE